MADTRDHITSSTNRINMLLKKNKFLARELAAKGKLVDELSHSVSRMTSVRVKMLEMKAALKSFTKMFEEAMLLLDDDDLKKQDLEIPIQSHKEKWSNQMNTVLEVEEAAEDLMSGDEEVIDMVDKTEETTSSPLSIIDCKDDVAGEDEINKLPSKNHSDTLTSLKVQSSKIPRVQSASYKIKMKTPSGMFSKKNATSKRKVDKKSARDANLCEKMTVVEKVSASKPPLISNEMKENAPGEIEKVSVSEPPIISNKMKENAQGEKKLCKTICHRKTFVIKPDTPQNANDSVYDRRKTFVKKPSDTNIMSSPSIKNKRQTFVVSENTHVSSKLNEDHNFDVVQNDLQEANASFITTTEGEGCRAPLTDKHCNTGDVQNHATKVLGSDFMYDSPKSLKNVLEDKIEKQKDSNTCIPPSIESRRQTFALSENIPVPSKSNEDHSFNAVQNDLQVDNVSFITTTEGEGCRAPLNEVHCKNSDVQNCATKVLGCDLTSDSPDGLKNDLEDKMGNQKNSNTCTPPSIKARRQTFTLSENIPVPSKLNEDHNFNVIQNDLQEDDVSFVIVTKREDCGTPLNEVQCKMDSVQNEVTKVLDNNFTCDLPNGIKNVSEDKKEENYACGPPKGPSDLLLVSPESECESISELNFNSAQNVLPITETPIRRHIPESKKVFVFDVNQTTLRNKTPVPRNSLKLSKQGSTTYQLDSDGTDKYDKKVETFQNIKIQKVQKRKKVVSFESSEQMNKTSRVKKKKANVNVPVPMCQIEEITSTAAPSNCLQSKDLNDMSCITAVNSGRPLVFFSDEQEICDENFPNGNKISMNTKNKTGKYHSKRNRKELPKEDCTIDTISVLSKNTKKDKNLCSKVKAKCRSTGKSSKKNKTVIDKTDNNTLLVHAEVHPVPPENISNKGSIQKQELPIRQAAVVLKDILKDKNSNTLNRYVTEEHPCEDRTSLLASLDNMKEDLLPVDNQMDDKKLNNFECNSKRRRCKVTSYKEPSLTKKLRQ